MQIFIVIILVSSAIAYLSFKWLPNERKRKLLVRLSKKIPLLVKLLDEPKSTCIVDCSSCGACNATPTKENNNPLQKVIKIFPNSSALN